MGSLEEEVFEEKLKTQTVSSASIPKQISMFQKCSKSLFLTFKNKMMTVNEGDDDITYHQVTAQ